MLGWKGVNSLRYLLFLLFFEPLWPLNHHLVLVKPLGLHDGPHFVPAEGVIAWLVLQQHCVPILQWCQGPRCLRPLLQWMFGPACLSRLPGIHQICPHIPHQGRSWPVKSLGDLSQCPLSGQTQAFTKSLWALSHREPWLETACCLCPECFSTEAELLTPRLCPVSPLLTQCPSASSWLSWPPIQPWHFRVGLQLSWSCGGCHSLPSCPPPPWQWGSARPARVPVHKHPNRKPFRDM